MIDEQIKNLIDKEKARQLNGLELIPSENYVSQQVLEALGSVLTNKYSEGYPGRRYYGGQQYTDKVEQLAIDRAKKLFRADHANVQPHSGASANEAVYSAWLKPGDTILAMDLSHGGHLTHGAPVTRSAKLYDFRRYKMSDINSGSIDYKSLLDDAVKYKPKIIMAGFSAYPRELDYDKFVEIGNKVGALLVADMSHIAGLIAAGVAKNPLDYGFHVMTTTTHKTLRGPRGGMILSKGTVGNPLKAPEKTIDNIPTLIDRAVFPGLQGGPHMNTIAAKAVALYEAMQPDFADYAKQVVINADALANNLQKHGMQLITGGTSNHLILANVYNSFGIDGKTAEIALDKAGLTVNANIVPDDPLPPFRPSGIRLGTPAVTTRGMKVADMDRLGEWIIEVIKNHDSDKVLKQIKVEVSGFASKLPLHI